MQQPFTRGHALITITITTLPLMVDGLVSCHAAAPHPTHHPTVWRPVVMVVLGLFFTWLIIVWRTWCFIMACPLPYSIFYNGLLGAGQGSGAAKLVTFIKSNI